MSFNADLLESYSDRPESILTEDIPLQIAVASHPDTPRNLLAILAKSDRPKVAEAAQMHVSYGEELQGNWQEILDNKLKSRYMGQNDRLCVELLKIAPLPVYFLSEYVPPEYLIEGLNNPYLSKSDRLQLLARLAKEPTLEPRLYAAESSNTAIEILEQLIGDLELSVRIAVQYNPNCPPELVELITRQYEVASNWDADSQQLDNLSNSNWDWIRFTVAQNPSTPQDTLLKLAEDKVFKIQLAIAKNPVTPASVLSVLAEHSSKEIQATVAKHPHATESILHSLFDTQQRVIESRDNLPASILERIFNKRDKSIPLHKYDEIRNILLKQVNTPPWILAEFANFDMKVLKAEILACYKESITVSFLFPEGEDIDLEQWIKDDRNQEDCVCFELYFLADIAKHPQTSISTLENLAKFSSFEIKLAIIQNPKVSQALKEELLKQLLTTSQDYIKDKIASDPETPIEILERLAEAASSSNQMIEMLRQIAPNITNNLLDRIKEFIDRHKSPELVLFWLQQGKEFQASILNDWDELLAALDEAEKVTLEYICSRTPTEEWKGKFTVERKTPSRPKRKIEPERMLLQRLMYLLNRSYNSDIDNQDIIAALLGNPSTPANLRQQLWQQYKQEPDEMGRYPQDAKFRITLAYNTSIPEAERMEYFRQLIQLDENIQLIQINGNIPEKIAQNFQTPTEILMQLMNKKGSTRQAVAKNHNAPHSALKELAKDENRTTRSWVAENLNTPVDILIELIDDGALNNPNFNPIEKYRLLIVKESKQKIDKTKQILVKRKPIPYLEAVYKKKIKKAD